MFLQNMHKQISAYSTLSKFKKDIVFVLLFFAKVHGGFAISIWPYLLHEPMQLHEFPNVYELNLMDKANRPGTNQVHDIWEANTGI